MDAVRPPLLESNQMERTPHRQGCGAPVKSVGHAGGATTTGGAARRLWWRGGSGAEGVDG